MRKYQSALGKYDSYCIFKHDGHIKENAEKNSTYGRKHSSEGIAVTLGKEEDDLSQIYHS